MEAGAGRLLHWSTAAGALSASLHGDGTTCVVLGHGAGGTRRQPALLRFAAGLAERGRSVLLFNFPYSEAGHRRPDPRGVLEAAVASAADQALRLGARKVVLGGRSMGGRMASQAVAAGLPADGLLFLAYPLHPPGQPERLRAAHLCAIACPLLFLQGTRDAFARGDLLASVVGRLGARAELQLVPEADHSFALPRRLGRTVDSVHDDLVARAADWLTRQGL